MKILNNSARMVCEIKGCTRAAAYKLILDDNEEESVCLCEKCLKDFYSAASNAVKAEDKKRGKKE